MVSDIGFIYKAGIIVLISMTKASESDPSDRTSFDSLSNRLDGIKVSGLSSFLAITSFFDDGKASVSFSCVR